MKNTIKLDKLNPKMLSRKAFADTLFTGYTGEIYTYVLDVLVSQTKGNIINKFWILSKVNEDTFIQIPNGSDGFIFETHQQDGNPLKDINNELILVKDLDGNILMEDIETENDFGEIVIVQQELLRKEEFTRNIDQFADIIIPAVNVTIDRYLGLN